MNGVMVALPCYTKVKTQMKLHPRLLCENTSALGETLATDKISHHTYKSVVQPAMERTLRVTGVTNRVNFEGTSLDWYRIMNDVKPIRITTSNAFRKGDQKIRVFYDRKCGE